MMQSKPFIDEKRNSINIPLFDRVGTAHNNMAFSNSTIELNQMPTIPDTHPLTNENSSQTTTKPPIQSTPISFHHIDYYVGSQQENSSFQRFRQKIFPFCKLTPRKQILCDVTGQFTFGMNAILGRVEIFVFQKISFQKYFSPRTFGMWKIIIIGYSC